jgi:hypothetical protein
MRTCISFLLLSLSFARSWQLPASLKQDRRSVLCGVAAAAGSLGGLAAPSVAADTDPNAMMMFEQNAVCERRTLLGACAEQGKSKSVRPIESSVNTAPRTAANTPEPIPEGELVQKLLRKTEENKEANAREVLEKTVAASNPGLYGPFAREAPVMRADGSFDSIPISRFEKLKDKGKIVVTRTGLDAYAKGFDPDAAEPKREKFLGLF